MLIGQGVDLDSLMPYTTKVIKKTTNASFLQRNAV